MNATEDREENGKKMKKKSKKNKTDDMLNVDDGNGNVEMDEGFPKAKKSHKHKKKRKSESTEEQHDKGNLVNDLQKDKKKKKRKREASEQEQINEMEPSQNDEHVVEKDCDPNPVKKKKKKSKKTDGQASDIETNTSLTEEPTLKNDSVKVKGSNVKKKKKTDGPNSDTETNTSLTQEPALENESVKVKGSNVKKKKKTDSPNSDTETNTSLTEEPALENDSVKVKGSNVKKKSTEPKPKPKPKTKSKRVSFSGHVEVFPSPETDPETGPETEREKQTTKDDGLVRGKRFTPEEDEIVKEAVLNYIAARDLGDDGLKMVLNCNSHPGMKKCWQEIGTCIPYRPYSAVYYRAHILFERAETRKWTPEEIESLKEFHKKYGNSWKKLAEEMGKHRFHVKDTWRRIKLENLKNGKWTQQEYQNLYDLVNLDLQMKVNGQEKKSKHGMLRDNIPWTAISEKLETRSDATCCTKWYNQLTSSLVVEKKWCDADDYRLIGALYELDATCQEDVDWDELLEHRSGDVCLKRWNQMVKHIGHQGSQPFAKQVDTLAKRYCPDLAETREIWDNKPVVP